MNAQTGEQVWHYQVTPGDNWDFDATQPLMQATLRLGGQRRKVLMQASKNGFFYVIDRLTGKFISGTPYVDGITWAMGIDSATGRPVESPAGYQGMKPVLSSPDNNGAHNWHPIAMDPTLGLVFLGVRSGSLEVHAPDKNFVYDSTSKNIGKDPKYVGELVARQAAAPPPRGDLLAWNPVERKEAWRVALPVSQSGGVLATAGNIVLQGAGDGILRAYRSSDGVKLWEFNAGTGIMAPPITYLVNGVQQVTVMVGWGGNMGLSNNPIMGPVKPGYGRILTFALGGTKKLEVPFYGHKEPPVAVIKVTSTPEMVAQGAALYAQNCAMCHGRSAIAGPVPDLRYSTAQVHAQLDSIVLGGLRAPLGMPSFKGRLDSAQLRLIQVYILARAAAGDGTFNR